MLIPPEIIELKSRKLNKDVDVVDRFLGFFLG